MNEKEQWASGILWRTGKVKTCDILGDEHDCSGKKNVLKT